MVNLQLQLANQLDEAGKRIILTDATIYDTTNPRESLALFPVGVLNHADGSTSSVTFDVSNPFTATTWNALPQTDGWYSFQLVYAPVVLTPLATNYPAGTILFSRTNFKLLKVVADPVTLLRSFVEATPLDLVVTNSSPVQDQLFLPTLSFLLVSLNEKIVNTLIDSENVSNTKRLVILRDAYDQVRSCVQGALYQFCIHNTYMAARITEFILTNDYADL